MAELISDFTSTMDVVMTPEERAEMEAAAEEEKAAAATEGVPASSTDPQAATAEGATHAATADHASTPSTATGQHSLAHHSSFSSQPSPSGSSSDLAKKEHGKDAAKAKAKLSPEQKAQLEALEKKQDEDKKARWVRDCSFLIFIDV